MISRFRYISILLYSFAIIVLSCKNDKNKSKFIVAQPICDRQLYLATYEISTGGAHDGDRISAYLTDSSNFREYLRTYDNNHEALHVECSGTDEVTIQINKRDPVSGAYVKDEVKTFNLKELRKMKKFD